MTSGFLITFREGLEAFLVVGIILSYLARSGLKKYNKWVYIGVGLGILSAFFIGFLFQVYYSGFESTLGEHYLKIVVMGLAVIVLTYMLVWMTKNSQNIKGDIEGNLENVVTTGNILPIIFMGYLAVLREGFETVLFLGALYGDKMSSSIYYGGILGLFSSLLFVVLVFKGMKNVPLKKFFAITGILIMLVSGGLMVNMVGLLQDVFVLPFIKPHIFDLGWFMNDASNAGIFFRALFGYTHSPSLLQVISYFGYLFGTYLLLNYELKEASPNIS